MARTAAIAGDDARVLAEQTRMVHRQAPTSLAGGLLVLGFAVVVFRDRAAGSALAAWTGAVVGMSLVRFVSWRGVRARIADDEAALRWLSRTTAMLACSGIVWGTGLAVLYDAGDALQVALVVIFCSALAAGAVVPLSPRARCYQAYAIPLVLPLAGMLIASGHAVFPIIGAALTFFLVVNVRYSRNVEASMIALIRSEQERARLIDDLEHRQAELLVARDEAEKQAQIATDANRARSRFLAAASHDLAQPLHSLGLFLDSLAHELRTAGQPVQTGLVEKARACRSAMAGMFSSLLETSKLEAGVVDVRPLPIGVRALLDPVLSEFLAEAEARGLAFEVDVEDCVVHTDPEVFRRIVRNLLKNAVTHTECGAVGVRVRPRPDAVEVGVFDTGAGIPGDELDHVFGEFYQARSPRRGSLAGLGLGLSIVRGLSRLLDVGITVQSTPGAGTTFSLSVPPGRAPVAADSAPAARAPAIDLSGKVIVLIEDDDTAREAMATVLEREARELVVAADATSAVSALAGRTTPPDAIVADVELGGGPSGLEAIDRLRDEFNTDVPALVVTGRGSPELLDTLRARGLPLLSKPFSDSELLEAVAALPRGR